MNQKVTIDSSYIVSPISNSKRTSLIYHQLVHAAGSKGGANGVDNSSAGVDIGDKLPFALGTICAFLEQNDLGLLMMGNKGKMINNEAGWGQ